MYSLRLNSRCFDSRCCTYVRAALATDRPAIVRHFAVTSFFRRGRSVGLQLYCGEKFNDDFIANLLTRNVCKNLSCSQAGSVTLQT